jgi:UDP-glucose 4-epimerase
VRIAITGATGLIGRCLVERLSEHELLLLGRSGEKLRETFQGRRKVTLCETDYSPESLSETLNSAKVLVHLAARPVRKDLPNFSDYYWIVRISENLFKTCSALGIQSVVFASTAMIYSPKVNQMPFLESEAVHPSTLYAISKLTAENIGFSYNLNLKCMRLALITLSERRGLMLDTFIQRALEKQPITVYGDGKGVREYLYVKDAAAAIEAAIQAPEVRGVFNIGLGVATSHRELAELVSKVFSGGASKVWCDLTKPEAPSRYPMDITRAREILGWKPAYSLKQALEEMKQYHAEETESK